MKKVTRQLIALILALCALASAAMPAWAASVDTPPEEPLAPEYVGISTLIYNCTVSSGTATCTTSVHLKNGYTAYTSMRLHKSVDKSNWSNVIIWMSYSTTLNKTKSVSSGYYYRTQVTVRVYDSNHNLVETVTKSSGAIYY